MIIVRYNLYLFKQVSIMKGPLRTDIKIEQLSAQALNIPPHEQIEKNMSKKSQSHAEFNPFILQMARVKIDKTINGNQFLSYSNLTLSSKRQIKSLKPNQSKLEQSSSKNQQQNPRQRQISNRETALCHFCAKKIFIIAQESIDKHLNSCSEAIKCKNCNEYILKASKKQHKMACRMMKEINFNSFQPVELLEEQSIDNQILEFFNSNNGYSNSAQRKINKSKVNKKPCHLKSLRFNKQQMKNYICTACIICNIEMEEDEKMRLTKCNHIFHEDCIDSWILVKQSCPTCHQSLLKS